VDSSRLPAKSNLAPGCPHAGFHSLIGRIFTAALECYFDTGRIVVKRFGGIGRQKPLLSQFSGRDIKPENQVAGFPLKGL